MKLQHKIACIAAAVAMSASAQAAPFYIDPSSIQGLFNLGGSAVSNQKDFFRLGYFSNTTVDRPAGSTPAFQVGDAVSTFVGIGALDAAGNATNAGQNNFAPVLPGGTFVQNAYYGRDWQIAFTTLSPLTGEIESIAPNGSPQLSFTGGVLGAYLYDLNEDPATATLHHFMNVEINGTVNTPDSHYLTGTVSFADPSINLAFGNLLQSADFSCAGNSGFLALATCAAGSYTTNVQIDFNTDITQATFASDAAGNLVIRGDHDGSVRFETVQNEVPEPGTLALVGLGLIGLVSMGRRRSAKH